MAFSGTQQKCKACDKTVYLVEQLTADGVIYHKSCFRCNHCKGTLKVSLLVSVSASLFGTPFFFLFRVQYVQRAGSDASSHG
jgi:cysteine/glycine-rich protein